MVLGVQVLGFAFAIFMAYITFLSRKRKEFTKVEYTFWTCIWTLLLIFAIWPQALDPVTISLKFSRTFDLLILGAIMFLIGALFYVYTVIRSLQRRLETVVREVALKRK